MEARLVLEPLPGPEVELKRNTLRRLLDDESSAWFVIEEGHEMPMPEALRVGVPTALVGRTTLRWEPKPTCKLPPPAALRHVVFERGDVDREATLPVLSADPAAHVTIEGPATVRALDHGVAAVTIVRHINGPVLRAGGPFVGLGGSGSTQGDEKFRLATRVGYEFARPSWLMHSLSVETNFRGVSVVPATELAVTHSWLGTLSVGAGGPLRIADRSAVGVRLQFGIVFPIVGFVTAVDFFPGLHGPERHVVSLFGQISL